MKRRLTVGQRLRLVQMYDLFEADQNLFRIFLQTRSVAGLIEIFKILVLG